MPTLDLNHYSDEPLSWAADHYRPEGAVETLYEIKAKCGPFQALHVCGLSRAEAEALHASLGQALQDADQQDAAAYFGNATEQRLDALVMPLRDNIPF